MDYFYPPIHEQSCSNCRYSRSLSDVDDAISCRRHAPVIVPELLDPLCYGSWPVVPIGQWCGEWCGREDGPAVPSREPASVAMQPTPASSLVERLTNLLGHHGDGTTRAVIREVAAALLEWHDSDQLVRTAWEAAKWLQREANQ